MTKTLFSNLNVLLRPLTCKAIHQGLSSPSCEVYEVVLRKRKRRKKWESYGMMKEGPTVGLRLREQVGKGAWRGRSKSRELSLWSKKPPVSPSWLRAALVHLVSQFTSNIHTCKIWHWEILRWFPKRVCAHRNFSLQTQSPVYKDKNESLGFAVPLPGIFVLYTPRVWVHSQGNYLQSAKGKCLMEHTMS